MALRELLDGVGWSIGSLPRYSNAFFPVHCLRGRIGDTLGQLNGLSWCGYCTSSRFVALVQTPLQPARFAPIAIGQRFKIRPQDRLGGRWRTFVCF